MVLLGVVFGVYLVFLGENEGCFVEKCKIKKPNVF